jgi:hypothetical protein
MWEKIGLNLKTNSYGFITQIGINFEKLKLHSYL